MHDLDGDIFPITVPKWGISMEDGIIVQWLVELGGQVNRGQGLVEIETSKILNVVESTEQGVLRRVMEDVGQDILVGQLIGVIASEDVSDEQLDTFVESFRENYLPPERAAGETSNYKFLDTNNYNIRYLQIENTSESNYPAVFIHGFGGDCDNWMFNISALAAQRTVYALDMPGHGGSSKDVIEGSVVELASTVLDFMRALDLDMVHLVGHSLGAAVAMEVGKQQKKRVASLALLGPSGLGKAINNSYVSGFIAGQKRRALKQTLTMLFADKTLVTRHMVDAILKFKRIDGVEAALHKIANEAFPGGLQRHSYRESLAEESASSTAIIWGACDEIADPGDLDGLKGRQKVHLLAGIGHMPHMEAVTQVNDILMQHMSQSDA